jgi:DNA-binding MarR family transcriptional regulator
MTIAARDRSWLSSAQAYDTVTVACCNGSTAQTSVRKLIADRRERERHFDAELFADPAWDILLDLYAAALAGQIVSASALCAAAAVPSTTARRWIGILDRVGMITCLPDPNDKRRTLIQLTQDTRNRMQNYLRIIAG